MNAKTLDKPMLVRLLVCCGILAGFMVGVLMPQMNAVDNLKKSTRAIRIAIEEQKLLQPKYRTMQTQALQAANNTLPAPPPEDLAHGTLQGFMQRVKHRAATAGLETRFILPQPGSVADSPDTLAMEASFKGPFTAIRDFLVSIGNLGAIDRVEHLLMESDYDQIRLTLRFFVRLKGTGGAA